MFRPAYWRSPKLMKLARRLPCMECSADNGTICGAHSNQLRDGKGKAIKAPDYRIAALCFTCHGNLDQGQLLTKAERVYLWDSAHFKTFAEFLRRGYLVLQPGLPAPVREAWGVAWAKDPRAAIGDYIEQGYLIVPPELKA